MLNRNLATLVTAQLVSVSGSIMAVQLGPIVGTALAPDPGIGTLPLSFMVVGTALAAAPAALTMQRIGRRAGFVAGALSGAAAMALAAFSIGQSHFGLFCLAMTLFGVNLAVVQQYRFAAAESVAVERTATAVSIVLLGSIGGALLGPQLVAVTGAVAGEQAYAPAFAAVALLLLGSALLLALGFRNDGLAVAAPAGPGGGRSVGALLRVRGLAVAIMAGVASYGVMTLIMTATPISMHLHDGHSMDATGWVISSHVVAMYLPSLFSGWLIQRFGCRAVMAAGVALFGASLLAGLNGQEVMHYWLALVALGVGWNFLYVGGTTLLTRHYAPEERFRAQALNDFAVFGMSALASLASGAFLQAFGWSWLMLTPLPLLAAVAAGLWLLRPADTAPEAAPGR